MLDLSLGDDQVALADAVRRFCADHCTEEVVRSPGVPDELWRGLADLGLLALGTPEGGGEALDIVAAMEQLGAAACPGPLVPTLLAGQLLDEERRIDAGKGELVVAVAQRRSGSSDPALVPWAPVAGEWIELSADGRSAWLARPVGAVEAVETLAGEPWGRVALERGPALAGIDRAVTVAHLATAAYLVGAGGALLDRTADYARDRVQFRTPIGAFQAVAHPLADSTLTLTAARTMTRIAAHRFDSGQPTAPSEAAAARLSAARAAVDTAYRAHQTFGAMGFTVEGPVAHVSARVRQVSLLPPGPGPARTAVLASAGFGQPT